MRRAGRQNETTCLPFRSFARTVCGAAQGFYWLNVQGRTSIWLSLAEKLPPCTCPTPPVRLEGGERFEAALDVVAKLPDFFERSTLRVGQGPVHVALAR